MGNMPGKVSVEWKGGGVMWPVLKFGGFVSVPATTEVFVASERLVRGTNLSTGVRIGDLGNDFRKLFLTGRGKIEGPQEGVTLCYHTPQCLPTDFSIVSALGGERFAETALSHMLWLMKRHADGEEDTLAGNSRINLFCVRDDLSHTLRAVRLRRTGGGWFIGAGSVDGLAGTDIAGLRVFSRAGGVVGG